MFNKFLIGMQNRINNKIDKDALTFSGTIEDYIDESELKNIRTLQIKNLSNKRFEENVFYSLYNLQSQIKLET